MSGQPARRRAALIAIVIAAVVAVGLAAWLAFSASGGGVLQCEMVDNGLAPMPNCQ
ncbi:MAG: hypothetical protein ACK4MD_10760 [Demequina sp.]